MAEVIDAPDLDTILMRLYSLDGQDRSTMTLRRFPDVSPPSPYDPPYIPLGLSIYGPGLGERVLIRQFVATDPAPIRARELRDNTSSHRSLVTIPVGTGKFIVRPFNETVSMDAAIRVINAFYESEGGISPDLIWSEERTLEDQG